MELNLLAFCAFMALICTIAIACLTFSRPGWVFRTMPSAISEDRMVESAIERCVQWAATQSRRDYEVKTGCTIPQQLLNDHLIMVRSNVKRAVELSVLDASRVSGL